MTELKTLKDIVNPYFECEADGWEWVDPKELRQEAIKWVKAFDDAMHLTNFFDDSTMSKQRWIKHFFNITEEDLK